MRFDDWRTAGQDELVPLYALERLRWLKGLAWETSSTWAMAEQGRRNGALPGYIAREPSGRIVGWSFFSVERGNVRIGAIDSDRAEVVRELIDHVLEAPEAAYAKRFRAFLFPRSSAVRVALVRRRFLLTPQLLLSCPLDRLAWTPERPGVGRPWLDQDLPGFVRLLARAYAGSPVSEAFAPEGRLEEWVTYVAQLVNTAACGVFLPQASIVVPGDAPDLPAGALLTTKIGDGVWHIAQVATDPKRRREGLARRMVKDACERAATSGAQQLTLVVDERNDAARALYADLGFQARGSLLYAARGRITRTTSRTVDAAVSAS
jgi:ribosomal protein S18 acetylase RimI-like enzyme